ncbi:MAG: type II secretion system protein GspG [Methylobacterium sp.]|nr:MAG: type II secretion system protein GspG [Methylobacterium sp.]
MVFSVRSSRSINRSSRRRRRGERGFSLVEILVVVAILGMLVGLVGPNVLGLFQSSRAKTAEVQVEQLRSALDMFLLDTGRYPTEAEGLASLVDSRQNIAGWRGPYLKGGKVPQDPWGRPFRYEIVDGQARVTVDPNARAEGSANGATVAR